MKFVSPEEIIKGMSVERKERSHGHDPGSPRRTQRNFKPQPCLTRAATPHSPGGSQLVGTLLKREKE